MLSVVFPVTFFSWVAELTRLGCTLDLDKGFDLVASRSAWRLLLFTCFGPCGVRVSLRQLLQLHSVSWSAFTSYILKSHLAAFLSFLFAPCLFCHGQLEILTFFLFALSVHLKFDVHLLCRFKLQVSCQAL
jgi:hypothetical protein